MVLPRALAAYARRQQVFGTAAQHHAVRRGQCLEPCGNAGGVAEHRHHLLHISLEHVPDHDDAGVDADANRDPPPALADPARVHFLGRLDHLQTGAHGAVRAVLMGFGVAEEDQHAVAEIAGDDPAIAHDRRDRDGAMRLDQRAKILGIHAVGKPGGIHQVGEHDGELAPLQRPASAAGRLILIGGLGGLGERATAVRAAIGNIGVALAAMGTGDVEGGGAMGAISPVTGISGAANAAGSK